MAQGSTNVGVTRASDRGGGKKVMGLAHTSAVDTEAALRRSNLGSTWRLPFTRRSEWVDRCSGLRCGSKVSDNERSG